MTEQDVKNKNLVLITYLDSIIDNFKIKAEYSTNSNDEKIIVVQEDSGDKVVFFDTDNPLFNYYTINIYGDNIQEEKETSVIIGQLIGDSVLLDFETTIDNKKVKQKWQIIFMQMANPRTIEYMDIRRVAYTTTLKCIVNKVA